ncbi:FtsK-like DNA translocase [Gordonia phage DirtyBoi]|nr:FtsK-like DNA translocase [Gordonia phage DirtyBoi]
MVGDVSMTDRQPNPNDKLLVDAARLVIETQFASAPMLQRKLHIWFARADLLLDELEGLGIVGPAQGTKARRVLVPAAEVQAAVDRIGGPE